MKILALNPPFLPKFSRESRSPAVTKSGTLYYPMWLAYAVGYLEKDGHEVDLVDAPAAGMEFEQLAERAERFEPRMAVLDTSTPSIYSDIDVARRLKERIPGLFTVLVGVHVSALPEDTLSVAEGVDVVAVGEYDETVRDLAGRLESRGEKIDLSEVRGIAFRGRGGKITVTKSRDFLTDLDEIPYVSSVYRKHLDINPYFYGHSRHPLIVLVTGRGCPFHCTYCVVPQTLMGHRYRKRSVENIIGEFKYIKENFPHVREIMIEDDTLTADRKRCREFAEGLIRENLTSIPWSANSRADVDYETMRVMRKAGCRLFCVGFESGDQRILDNIKKNMKIERIYQFMRDAKKAKIMIHGCFMVGNPGEGHETLRKTLSFAKQLNPDTAQFYPIMVYPGTEAYAHFEEQGAIVSHNFRDWLDAEGLHSSVVSHPSLSYDELVSFCDQARRAFYLRPVYIASKLVQIVRMPGEAKRIFKAFGTFYKYLLHRR